MIRVDVGTLATLLGAVRAGWTDTTAVARVAGVVTDSREAGPGDVYVARRGAHLDGARFAGDAVSAGAAAVIADRPLEVPTLVVADAHDALVRLAAIVRARAGAVVVGITGSVGKTTTKDLLAAAAGATRATVAAHGSYNNEVGVPLTVCRATDDTEVLVTELGARGRGHIADLTAWLRPDIAVVTVVAGAHLELFHTLDQVAEAKAELVQGLQPDGVAVLNADDPRVLAMARLAPGRVVTVSVDGAQADLTARDVGVDGSGRAEFTAVTPWGSVPVRLPIVGRHHVGNALLALAAAVEAGADLAAAAAALADAPVSTGRGRLVTAPSSGLLVVDDTYNANPTSVLAALDALGELATTGRRVAVLGVMAEIGADHDAEHRRVGRAAAAALDHLVVVGPDAVELAVGARAAGGVVVEVVDDVEGAVDAVLDLDPVADDVVLVKASRVAALDRVVDRLVDTPGPTRAPTAGPPTENAR